LKDDIDIGPATLELNAIGGRLKSADPQSTKEFLSLDAQTLVEAFVGGTSRPFFAMVITSVFFVLLISCANVANLLLSRSASRAREMALRMSIGATRTRLVRQLLMESVVLGLSGGVLGTVIASLGVPIFESAMQASEKPYWMVFSLDSSVVAYVGMICLVVAFLSGLAPALHISRTNGLDVLKEGGRGVTGSARVRWFSEGIVVAQLSLTVVLLAGAGFMVRSFLSLYSADIGVDPRLLVSMKVELPPEKYATADVRRAFFKRLSDEVSAVAGIDAAAVTTGVPPLDGGERLLELERDAGQSGSEPRWASIVAAGPRFFSVLDRAVRRGRDFEETDGGPGLETVIINQRLADLFFPAQDPIGRRLRFTSRSPAIGAPLDPWRTVIGVSAPIRQGSPQDEYLGPVAYVPYFQDAPRSASLLLRSSLPLAAITAAARTAVQAIDPDQPIAAVQTVEQMMEADRWPFRIFGTLFGILAATALSLSAIGLYGVIACSVARRTQEIGVRMAVGARRSQVSWLVLRQGLKQLAVGLPLGLTGALALGAALQGILVTDARVDVVTLGTITVLLIAVSVCACLLPAWRATRVDPVVALRAD
jgi:predicted permease